MDKLSADNPYDGIVKGLKLAYEMVYIKLKHQEIRNMADGDYDEKELQITHFSPISQQYISVPTQDEIEEVIREVKTLATLLTKEDFIRAEVEAQLECGLDSDFIHWNQSN